MEGSGKNNNGDFVDVAQDILINPRQYNRRSNMGHCGCLGTYIDGLIQIQQRLYINIIKTYYRLGKGGNLFSDVALFVSLSVSITQQVMSELQ